MREVVLHLVANTTSQVPQGMKKEKGKNHILSLSNTSLNKRNKTHQMIRFYSLV